MNQKLDAETAQKPMRPVVTRLEPQLYSALEARAVKNCRTISQEVRFLLGAAVAAEEAKA